MKKILATIFFAFTFYCGYSQIQSPVKWAYSFKKGNGSEAIILIKATIDNRWHIYSINQQDGGPRKTTIAFVTSKDFSLLGKVVEPKPITKFEDVFGIDVSYFEQSVTFSQKIKLKAPKTIVKINIEFMACTSKECRPPDYVTFNIPIK